MAQSAVNRVYQDFDPFYEWSEDERSATLVVMLPGFAKEQLKVQVTSAPVLRINGERRMVENIWRRFAKEFSIPQHCDTNEVSARFELGILTIKFPKVITPFKPPPQELAPMPQRPSAKPEAPTQSQESQQKEKEPTRDEIKEESKTEESQEKEKEPIGDEKEKTIDKTEEVAPKKEVAQEIAQDTTTTTTKVQEKPKAKLTQRLKTRVLDFTVSLRSIEDKDGNQGGFVGGGSKIAKLKRPKMWFNIVVAILLVMVLGLYVKNAFRPSQLGESKFQEF